MKIVWDLDGVLRDLNLYLNTKMGVPYPQEWFWKYEDKDIFEWIAQDRLYPLVYSPATEYERIAKYCFDQIEIWTNQPDNWIPYTKLWIENHFPDAEIRYLDNKQKREWLDKEENTILIEDNPLFTHYNRILLIDRPYNRHINNAIRIHNAEELHEWIAKLLELNTIMENQDGISCQSEK